MVVTTGKGTDARLALGAAADKGSRDEVLPIAKKKPPPLDDLGKVCAKFNVRSRGYMVSTK